MRLTIDEFDALCVTALNNIKTIERLQRDYAIKEGLVDKEFIKSLYKDVE